MKELKLCLALQGVILLLYFILMYLGVIVAVILIFTGNSGAMFFLRPAIDALLAPPWLHLILGTISFFSIVYFHNDDNGEYLEKIINEKLTQK
ncbi:MAG: hypothetical protein ACOX6C_01725 [Patescibacteria group bacterium]|jgi:hypothetical protein